ncbi:MAG: ABC transporter permease [Actinomycetota bacterium]|nr:ABC transporter permease [Actinomycetota bacterium]
MFAYCFRRLLAVAPILIGVTLLLFILLQVLPGDPARMLTGYRTPSPQALSNLQGRMGTKASLVGQYANYLLALSRGDLGRSYRTQRPVVAIIGETLPNSLALAALALSIEMLIGVPAGALAAIKRGSLFDRGSMVASTLLAATPVFALGLLFQLVLGVRLKWLPVTGAGSFSSYLMPALVMALIAAAYLVRVVRSSLLDVLAKDYITAARANGLSERRVLLVHGLKNALAPIIAVAGVHFGFLIGSAVATEVVFNWPGIGRQLFAAVMERDRPVVIGVTLVMATIFLLVNLIVDISQAWVNPRVREEG